MARDRRAGDPRSYVDENLEDTRQGVTRKGSFQQGPLTLTRSKQCKETLPNLDMRVQDVGPCQE